MPDTSSCSLAVFCFYCGFSSISARYIVLTKSLLSCI
nr:MAG TPA: hypothetical protein [Caudoviricetes sp.]